MSSLSGLFNYIETTISNINIDKKNTRIIYFYLENHLNISFNSALELELLQNRKYNSIDESLINLFDTKTLCGARLLRSNFLQPPAIKAEIVKRQLCVEELCQKKDVLDSLRDNLKNFRILEIHIGKFSLHVNEPTDNILRQILFAINGLRETLRKIKILSEIINNNLQSEYFKIFTNCFEDPTLNYILSRIDDYIDDISLECIKIGKKQDIILFLVKQKIDNVLDVSRKVYSDTINLIYLEFENLKNSIQDPTIRMQYNESRGFYVNIGESYFNEKDFTISRKEGKRYACSNIELLSYSQRIREIKGDIVDISFKVIYEVYEIIQKHLNYIHVLSSYIALIDVICAFAFYATNTKIICKPVIIENTEESTFIPNKNYIQEFYSKSQDQIKNNFIDIKRYTYNDNTNEESKIKCNDNTLLYNSFTNDLSNTEEINKAYDLNCNKKVDDLSKNIFDINKDLFTKKVKVDGISNCSEFPQCYINSESLSLSNQDNNIKLNRLSSTGRTQKDNIENKLIFPPKSYIIGRECYHPILEKSNLIIPLEFEKKFKKKKIRINENCINSDKSTSFVPNNYYITNLFNCLIIRGANAAGKTTYIKQLALLVILAQCGSFVPCAYFKLSLRKYLLTKFDSNDSIEDGKGTFLKSVVEIQKAISPNITYPLILLDEPFDSSTNLENLSLTLSLIEKINSIDNGPFIIISSHNSELSYLSALFFNVLLGNMAVEFNQDSLNFLYKFDFENPMLNTKFYSMIDKKEINNLENINLSFEQDLGEKENEDKYTNYKSSKKSKSKGNKNENQHNINRREFNLDDYGILLAKMLGYPDKMIDVFINFFFALN